MLLSLARDFDCATDRVDNDGSFLFFFFFFDASMTHLSLLAPAVLTFAPNFVSWCMTLYVLVFFAEALFGGDGRCHFGVKS